MCKLAKISLKVISHCNHNFLQNKYYAQSGNLITVKKSNMLNKCNRALWFHPFVQNKVPRKFFYTHSKWHQTEETNQTGRSTFLDREKLTRKNWRAKLLFDFLELRMAKKTMAQWSSKIVGLRKFLHNLIKTL